jgi:hypothetical protein
MQAQTSMINNIKLYNFKNTQYVGEIGIGFADETYKVEGS